MKKLFGYIVFLTWIVIVIDGLLPQLQMKMFNGNVPIPSIVAKLFLLILTIIYSIFIVGNFKIKLNLTIIRWWGIFLIYLLIHALSIFAFSTYSAGYVFFSYNAYYFYFIFFPLFFLLKDSISDISVSRILIIIFFPLAILGAMQYFYNDPILPVKSKDVYFRIQSWRFYGHVRAFSLFSTAESFGVFISLISGIAAARFYSKSYNKVISLILLLITFVAGYFTLTRSIFLRISMSVFAIFLFFRFKNKNSNKINFLKYLPIVYGVLGVFIAFIIPYIFGSLGQSGSILAKDSLFLRFASWAYYGPQWFYSEIKHLLFGVGIIQNDKFLFLKGIVIDNMFLAIGLHIGIIGLFLWIKIMWETWKYIFKQANEHEGIVPISVYGYWTTWIASGIFNITGSSYAEILLLFIITVPVSKLATSNVYSFEKSIRFSSSAKYQPGVIHY